MTKKFEVDFKERDAQRQTEKKLRWYRATGRKRYRVYEKLQNEYVTAKKLALNSTYGVRGKGTHITAIQGIGYNSNDALVTYHLSYEWFNRNRYEIQWLLPKQATALIIQGHQVEELE